MNPIWIPHLPPLRSIQDLPGSSRRRTALWEGLQGVGIDPAPGARRGKIEGRWLRWLVYHLSSVTCWNWGVNKALFLDQPTNGNLGHLWNDPQMVGFPQCFPRCQRKSLGFLPDDWTGCTSLRWKMTIFLPFRLDCDDLPNWNIVMFPIVAP